MDPIKQIFLGSAVGISLGLLLAMSLSWYETVEPIAKPETTIVWQGEIEDQWVVLTVEEMKE